MAIDGSIIQFRDELNGNATVYPLTHQNAVLGEDSQPLQTYITEYNVSQHHTNTDGTRVFTLSDAIAAVPDDYKRGGLKLSFNSNNGSVETYVLDSSVWSDSVSHWKQFDVNKLTELESEVHGTLIRKKLANLPYGVSENVLSFVAKANVEYEYSFSIYEALSNTSTLEVFNKNGEKVGIVAISSGDTISNVKTLKVESDTELTFNIYYPSTNGKDVLINISANDGIVKDIKVLNNKVNSKADLSLLNSVVAQDNFNIFGYNKEVLLPIKYGTNNINFYKLLPHVDYTIYITRGDEELEQQVYIKLKNAKDDSLLGSLNLLENSKKSASVHIYTEEPINTYFETHLSSGKVDAVVHIDVVPIDIKSLTAAYKAKGIYPQPRKLNSENFATKSEFVRVMNTLFRQYVDVAKCHISSFYRLFERDSWEEIQEKCNHNFRKDVVDFSASVEYNIDSISSALSERIYRFSDATLNTGWRECSINTGIQGDEPSVIISEDRKYMYVYARKYADFHYRWKTLDGVNYEEERVYLTGYSMNYLIHPNVNLIDGIYYLIGCTANSGGDLVLFTSTDGLNFVYKGTLFKAGHKVNDNIDVSDWGNVTLIKDYSNGKFYLFYEYEDTNVPQIGWTGWQIAQASCTDIFAENEDGTIGNWIESPNNPIFPYQKYFPGTTESFAKSNGNPDFAKGEDNRPIKHNGNYYLYYHGGENGVLKFDDSTDNGRSLIRRAYSPDLETWTEEGIIFDNRKDGTLGEWTPTNADHCIIEWKGRTYLFYSLDINSGEVKPKIMVNIDDRPLHVLLGLRP